MAAEARLGANDVNGHRASWASDLQEIYKPDVVFLIYCPISHKRSLWRCAFQILHKSYSVLRYHRILISIYTFFVLPK